MKLLLAPVTVCHFQFFSGVSCAPIVFTAPCPQRGKPWGSACPAGGAQLCAGLVVHDLKCGQQRGEVLGFPRQVLWCSWFLPRPFTKYLWDISCVPGTVWGTGVPRIDRQLPCGAAVGLGSETECEARASGVPSEIRSQALLCLHPGTLLLLQSFALLDINLNYYDNSKV